MERIDRERERTLIPELFTELRQLSNSELQKILWIAQGIVIADKCYGRENTN